MERATTRITLDVQKIDSGVQIKAKRGDSARRLVVSLTNRGRPYIPGEGVTAVFYERKPDGNPCFNEAQIDGCTVTYDFTGQTTNVEGLAACEIRLYDAEDHLLTSPRFELLVDGTEYQEGDVPDSSPEYTALTEMVAKGTELIRDLTDVQAGLEPIRDAAIEAANRAEAAGNAAEAAWNVARDAAHDAQEAYAGAAAAAGEAQTQAATAGNYAGMAQEARSGAERAEGEAAKSELAAGEYAGTAQRAAEEAGNAESLAKQHEAAAADASARSEEAAGEAESAAQRAEAAAERAETAQGSGGGAVELDTTLTESGMAADAKAVGDALKGYQPKGDYLTKAPVTSVNGKTGAVTLTAEDVDAMSAATARATIVNLLDEAKKAGELDGDPGADGRGIKSIARTSGNGAAGTVDTYTITYTDNTTSTYQVRNGANGGKGDDGNGIRSVVLNDDYTLTLEFDDGTSYTTPSIRGEAGAPGAPGVGISSAEQTATSTEDGGSNTFKFTLTNGNTATFTVRNGSRGSTGERGTGILKITTAPSSYTTATGGFTPTYRIALSTVLTQSKAEKILVGDLLAYSYYHYPVGYVDASYVYLGTRQNMRGATGATGTTPKKGEDYWTDADLEAMVADTKAALPTLTVTGVDADGVSHTWTLYGATA